MGRDRSWIGRYIVIEFCHNEACDYFCSMHSQLLLAWYYRGLKVCMYMHLYIAHKRPDWYTE